jgi:hypothetical protein
MACQPATCVVCGRESCCQCLNKSLVSIQPRRPAYWASQGNAPHAEQLWSCPDCNDSLTQKVRALNRKVDRAGKYMSEFVRDYCDSLDKIEREAQRRERSRSAGDTAKGAAR